MYVLFELVGVKLVMIMGYLMGGMFVICYVLMYLKVIDQFVFVNLIGFEDWKVFGVLLLLVDYWYVCEQKIMVDGICCYEQGMYYVGKWLLLYECWVQMFVGMYCGVGCDVVVWNFVLIYDMIFMQLVVYEFGVICVLMLLMIGDKDMIVIGKDVVLFDVYVKFGCYLEFVKCMQVVILGV